MAPFTVYDPASLSLSALVNALLASTSGMVLDQGSIVLHSSGAGAVNLYDASVGTPLGLGAGVLLTSGSTPGTSNTSSSFGADNSGSSGFYNGDADIDAVVNTVFMTQSYDATTLAFNFSVSTPTAVSVSVDLVFGSDEYPEWVDAFVDCAVLIVDGVNYALFNKDPLAPLSVISPNLAAGYFQDNGSGTIPIEYDGVSGHLRIVAPLNTSLSTHSIKIAIADTGDHILDSGLFIANLSAGSVPGSGVVSDPGGGTSANDTCSGTSKDEYFNLLAGDATVYAGGGADIVVAGAGNDQVFGGSGNDVVEGDGGNDVLDGGADLDTAVYSGASGSYTINFDNASGQYSLNGSNQGEGIDTLISIEQLQFSNGLFTLSETGGVVSLTALTPPPPPPVNTPGVVLVTGLAAVGYTLTAHLSDVDGLPVSDAIHWQWYANGDAILGATSSSYLVNSNDINALISAQVTYSDANANSEQISSSNVLISPPSDGDLTVTLMTIDGPVGAGINTPITSLLERAVELGATPNQALKMIRSTLKIPAAISNLLSFNSFNILIGGAGDTASALSLAKLEAEVAILCSLSDDQQGIKLTLALLDKAASGGSVDLSKASDVAVILGLDTSSFNLSDKATYPQPLREIIDRNSNISQATKLLGAGNSIENEWNDFLSNWDSMAGLPLSSLSQTINLAPFGIATAVLPHLSTSDTYILSLDQLTAGFIDPDGDTLNVPWLSTDHGDWFSLATDGSWQLDANAAGYDASYLGPLELSYSIDDGHGHSIAASQLLVVIDHVNHLPSGTVNVAVLGGGAPIQYANLQASNNLTDADQITTSITYSWYCGSTLFGQGNSIVLGQGQVGQAIHVEASYTDGNGTIESVSSAATAVVANVDDAPTGSVTLSVGNPPKLGDTVNASNDVADLDGIPSSGPGALLVQWQSSADGVSWSDIAGATSASLLLGSTQVGKKLRAQVRYTDLWGVANIVSSSASATVVGVGINWTGTSGNDSKSGTSWDDTLNGAAGSDKLTGLAGNDWLDGGIGIDTLVGGLGNDTYVVDNSSDLITEMATEGYDTVLASVSYSLLSKAVNVEALVLTGSAAINGTGNSLDNIINGNDAANVLDGGAGNDTMTGGGGNDTYVVDSLGDVIVEASGGGIDLVQSSISCSLAGLLELENLTLTGSAAINATGNGLANVLKGNSAANVLDGGAGNDSMTGGGGNDTYVVDSIGDVIVEASGGGTDLVQSSVSFSLLALSAVENLTLTGSATINATGNTLANVLTGNDSANLLQGSSGNDSINGGGGNDTLAGGKGSDQLTGGPSADVFRFDTAPEKLNGVAVVDTITDYSIAQGDRLELSSQAFSTLTGAAVSGGLLAANAFLASSNGTATTPTQRILYNTSTASLSYDPDGNGSTAAQAFAKFSAGLALSADQIIVSNLPLGL